MEEHIGVPDLSSIWKTVRAMIASALTFLRGENAARYLYGAQKRLRQAENKVREQLALMALRIEFSPPERGAVRTEKRSRKKRSRKRGFAVLPHGLYDYDYSYTPATPFDEPTPIEVRLAAFDARVEVLEAVMAAPERHAKRLARILKVRDAIGVSLRFFGAGIKLPIEQVWKFLPPTQPVPAINDSS